MTDVTKPDMQNEIEPIHPARAAGEAIARALRAIVGVPDYDLYLAHVLEHHPDRTPMTREEFERDRVENRYNKPGNRCC